MGTLHAYVQCPTECVATSRHGLLNSFLCWSGTSGMSEHCLSASCKLPYFQKSTTKLLLYIPIEPRCPDGVHKALQLDLQKIELSPLA